MGCGPCPETFKCGYSQQFSLFSRILMDNLFYSKILLNDKSTIENMLQEMPSVVLYFLGLSNTDAESKFL